MPRTPGAGAADSHTTADRSRARASITLRRLRVGLGRRNQKRH
ncbi:MAG TPA: hypothetical protein VKG02_19610 [Blastocatellia bacterium]|nr:hypothetical protein [Blastocatellia bacterium]